MESPKLIVGQNPDRSADHVWKIFNLPRIGSRDKVAELAAIKAYKKSKAIRTRCHGSNSCDCPRCK